MKKSILILSSLLLFIVLSSNIKANQIDKSAYYNFGEKFYVGANALPTGDGDSLEITVFFRLAHEIIPFTQLKSNNSFMGIPSVEITLKDTTGVIRRRALWDDTVYVAGYDETVTKGVFVYGCVSFKAATGFYDLIFQINDKYAQRIKKAVLRLNFDKTFFTMPSIAKPLFVVQNSANNDIFSPILLNGNLSFTSKSTLAFVPVTYFSGRDNFQYKLIKTKASDSELEWESISEFTGLAVASESAGIDFAEKCNQKEISLKISHDKYNTLNSLLKNIKFGLLKIEIPSRSLSPGNYTLQIFSPGSRDTSSFMLSVIWENQPISFKLVDYAVEMMYYILTEDEHDKLKSGSEKEQFKKLINYWKAKDPTPATPYNEAMAEYFKRVDYAYFNFQTAIQKDGAKSDRGKIYILHGAASKIENTLIDGKLTEIWKYDKLNKKFFFEAVSSGVYRLVKIDN